MDLKDNRLFSFDRSKVALEAIKLMGNAQTCGVEMSQHHYTLVQDILLVNVANANANRSSVLSEMTIKQLKHALKMDNNYIKLVLVVIQYNVLDVTSGYTRRS